jgi:[acyl-carrier-protein] S-malonyltransferase
MDDSLRQRIAASALAFRGYNVTNLGRTRELLRVAAYESTLKDELRRFGAVASDCLGRQVDLVRRIEEADEPGLDAYAEAVALVVAVESAHLKILREVHDVDVSSARLSFGYSLGELHAVCGGGLFAVEDLIRVPLCLATDCAALAEGTVLAVLFSRGPAIAEEAVAGLCVRASSLGAGAVGLSAILSPNSYLLVGDMSAVDRLREEMPAVLPKGTNLRLNSNVWPPLHTPLVRRRNVPDRASAMLEKIRHGVFPARPEVVSLVTGKRNYAEHNAREILRNWVDHPQRLWDAVCETLAADVQTILHLGPEPNVIPATFQRLADNVQQLKDGNSLESYGYRAITSLARRPWLASMLPARAALLRAPYVRHVIVEDWLLENQP